MEKSRKLKLLSLSLIVVLITAMALLAVGCNEKSKNKASSKKSTISYNEDKSLGVGKTRFTFKLEGPNGEKREFIINTDEKTVGSALQKLDLITGEEGDYGLYVRTVNGITVDFEESGMYWAFYEDGEYAMTGCDKTEIKPGSTYTFKAQK